MIVRRSRRALAAAIVLLGPLACGGDSPTESSAFSGVFDLVTVDAIPLPRLEYITDNGDTLFITGGEIRVLSRGRLSLVQRVRWHRRGGGAFPEQSDTLVLSYRLSGSQLLINYSSSVPSGPYTDTATFHEDAIVVLASVRASHAGWTRRQHRYHGR
jgi:hypothetical protein